MAEHLASIFGTEKDRVNCPFYFKIGACRHGDRCSRLHTKPTISPTLVLSNMYQRPDMNLNFINPTPNQPQPPQPPQPESLDPDKLQEHFDDFYEDLFEELSKYGQIQSLNICDNLADHMVGNVYVQYKEEDHAANALMNLTGRFYSGRPIIVDFSPVTDFREATCRQYEENVCNRGGYCNFMHLKKISRDLRKRLFGRSRRWNDRSGSRSRSPPRSRNYEGRSYSGRGSGRRDFDRPHGNHGRRQRSRSPRHRGKRSRSPGGRDRSPPIRDRESSVERRARIEQWNREKEVEDSGNRDNKNNNDYEEPSLKNGSESGNHQI
ncbi:splicing factor U2af small subunit B-like [Cicer arietinum]|uniref:Splicing factor U2af small subunit B-like n=1 Tax=Cicer arietinum TaxID=3827 RepID=A0A1S2XUE8_CICAR|nr:splicing factor U2af small subunit B-like [Cicer arietinum]